MKVRQAKRTVYRWVSDNASHQPGFAGAFIAGSTNWLPDDAPLPATSDVDVKIVSSDASQPDSIQMQLYEDLLLEVSYLSTDQFQSPEQILSSYYLANHFTTANIILDPSGQLARIQAAVAKEFARHKWVQRRCEDARNWVLTSLGWLEESQPLHEQVFDCLYPTSTLNHVLLVAGLQNPTVRRMYAATRDLLVRYDLLPFHDTLLTLLGSVNMDRAQVEGQLETTIEAFDAAKEVIKTPFFGSTQISDEGRPVAIGSSQRLIEEGYHREAMFGIIATHTWCQTVIFNDAPVALQEEFRPAYLELLSHLGLSTPALVQQRHAQVKEYLPQVWEVAEKIMANNPDIID